jgi:hypothetical protein
MKQHTCLDFRFKSPGGHGCPPLVFVVCCVYSCLCNELITHSQESYQVCMCVCVCDMEILTMRSPRTKLVCCTTEKEYDNRDWDLQISYYRLLLYIHWRTSNTTFYCNMETQDMWTTWCRDRFFMAMMWNLSLLSYHLVKRKISSLSEVGKLLLKPPKQWKISTR